MNYKNTNKSKPNRQPPSGKTEINCSILLRYSARALGLGLPFIPGLDHCWDSDRGWILTPGWLAKLDHRIAHDDSIKKLEALIEAFPASTNSLKK